MDAFAHFIAEGGVDALVTPDAAFALESSANHRGEEVTTVAIHRQVRTAQALGNICVNFLGSRLGHGVHIVGTGRPLA